MGDIDHIVQLKQGLLNILLTVLSLGNGLQHVGVVVEQEHSPGIGITVAVSLVDSSEAVMDFLTLAMMMTPSLATSSQLSQVIISRILLVHLPRYLRPLEMASPVLSSSLVILFLALSLRALPICLTSLSVLLVGVVFVLSLEWRWQQLDW